MQEDPPREVMYKPEIFQEKICTLTKGLEHAPTYITNLLFLSWRNLSTYFTDVKSILKCIRKVKIKLNVTKRNLTYT